MALIKSFRDMLSSLSNPGFLEEAFGDTTAVELLKKPDNQRLRSLFLEIPDNWSARYFYSLAMSRRYPLDDLRRWAEQEPQSPDAFLVYGARLLKWAWEARGYGRGVEISQEKWAEFYQRLELTREALEMSASLRPADPTPWAYLIMVGVYANYGEEIESRYFEYAIDRDPENWIAHMHRLTGLSEKYGGSHQRMFEFAEDVARNASEKSLLPILLTKAHSEYWKYLYIFEDQDAAAEDHIVNQGVRTKTLEAYNRSLGTHQFDQREAVFARINAAGWFWIIEQKEPLRRELTELEGILRDVHWRWVGVEGDLASASAFARS